MMNLESEGAALVSAKKAAKSLGIQYRTFLQILARGDLPGVRIGSQWFLHPAILASLRQQALIGSSPTKYA